MIKYGIDKVKLNKIIILKILMYYKKIIKVN